MRYDFKCSDCEFVWEVEKKITDPQPSFCPRCEGANVERSFGPGDVLPVLYANRPPWTYKECLKFKDCRMNDGPRTKVDPSKHGDLGAWNCPGEVVSKT